MPPGQNSSDSAALRHDTPLSTPTHPDLEEFCRPLPRHPGVPATPYRHPVTALMPPGRQHLPRVRVLVDYLADHFE